MRKRLAIRLSDAERETIDGMAAVCGLSVTDFIRRSALQQQLRPLPKVPESNLKIYSELGRLAGNVNQIAKAMNQGLPAEAGAQRIAQSLPGLVNLLRELREQLTTPPAGADDEEAE